ncbi:hypothetical protein ACIP5Y_28480 [Nocardia sp. NPDC088792]|uniref:hypothetical protein n=1 Tax=Nocardia sp. NPDC088792 TaxID=3364332 RepID=UPI00381BD140
MIRLTRPPSRALQCGQQRENDSNPLVHIPGLDERLPNRAPQHGFPGTIERRPIPPGEHTEPPRRHHTNPIPLRKPPQHRIDLPAATPRSTEPLAAEQILHADIGNTLCLVEPQRHIDSQGRVTALNEQLTPAIIEQQPQQIISNRNHGIQTAKNPLRTR